MKEELSFLEVQSNNHSLIKIIADWYFDEWEIPIDFTFQRLTHTTNKDVIFQLVLMKGNNPVATGGLYKKVSLLNVYPQFAIYGPWVAVLYTDKKNRNSGFGEKVLHKIESMSRDMGLNQLFLHTFSAENLYLKNNWIPMHRLPYKETITVIMKKQLSD